MQFDVKNPERRDWATWPVHMNCYVEADGGVRVSVLVQGSEIIHEVEREGKGDTVMAALYDAFKDESDPRAGGVADMVRVAFILGCQCGNGNLSAMMEDEDGNCTDGKIAYKPPKGKT